MQFFHRIYLDADPIDEKILNKSISFNVSLRLYTILWIFIFIFLEILFKVKIR